MLFPRLGKLNILTPGIVQFISFSSSQALSRVDVITRTGILKDLKKALIIKGQIFS
ncbi:unnamed protein product, partial [marine sediment metagenome]